jgi:hypothetical protein
MVVIAKAKLNEKMGRDKQKVARKVRVRRKLTFLQTLVVLNL